MNESVQKVRRIISFSPVSAKKIKNKGYSALRNFRKRAPALASRL
jgi:hypothetical protein